MRARVRGVAWRGVRGTFALVGAPNRRCARTRMAIVLGPLPNWPSRLVCRSRLLLGGADGSVHVWRTMRSAAPLEEADIVSGCAAVRMCIHTHVDLCMDECVDWLLRHVCGRERPSAVPWCTCKHDLCAVHRVPLAAPYFCRTGPHVACMHARIHGHTRCSAWALRQSGTSE